jgi:hypothetical protein
MVTADLLAASALPAPLQNRTPALLSVGASTLHWFGMHVYDIALYNEGPDYATNSTAALSIRYAISIKHRRLQETTLKEWKRLGQGTPEQHERWISRLDGLWPDVKPGDCLTAFRCREGPTQFFFGDRLLGEVTDPAFGPAFFAIWLDTGCRYPKVRDGLLKKMGEKGR